MKYEKGRATKRFIAISRLLFLLLFFLLLAGCQNEGDSWERIERDGVLRVGLDPSYPPFENGDSGELVGLDVDLARAIGRELGLEVRFAYFGYDGLYDALATNQVDVLISALVEDQTKSRDFAFSDPYFNAGQFLVVLQDNASIAEMADLGDKTMAVEIGSEGHVQGIEWQRRVPNLTIQTLPTADDALWVVLQGEADTAVVDQVSGRLYIRQFPDLRLVEEPVTVEPYTIVTRVDDVTLLNRLNEALEMLDERGELGEIQAAWLD